MWTTIRNWPADYGITSIPQVYIFKNGQPVERLVGAMPKKAYEDAVERALK
jgi:thioredoxin-like negative regulator of GroEL